jgi:hypothetical protein
MPIIIFSIVLTTIVLVVWNKLKEPRKKASVTKVNITQKEVIKEREYYSPPSLTNLKCNNLVPIEAAKLINCTYYYNSAPSFLRANIEDGYGRELSDIVSKWTNKYFIDTITFLEEDELAFKGVFSLLNAKHQARLMTSYSLEKVVWLIELYPSAAEALASLPEMVEPVLLNLNPEKQARALLNMNIKDYANFILNAEDRTLLTIARNIRGIKYGLKNGEEIGYFIKKLLKIPRTEWPEMLKIAQEKSFIAAVAQMRARVE